MADVKTENDPYSLRNCFPARNLLRSCNDSGGAWVVEYQAEERRRFKAILSSKPRDLDVSKKDGVLIGKIPEIQTNSSSQVDEDVKILDRFTLMKHCRIDSPSDLCSINISGQNFSEVKHEDFRLFDNVAYINAAENLLTLECFTTFPILRELELPVNGLRGLKITSGDFQHLQILDMSFNNLSSEDILSLSLIPQLRVLHLTGNNLRSLPPQLSQPSLEQESILRFPCLEVLLMDDNNFSHSDIFAKLATFPKLRQLNLSKNKLRVVPTLFALGNQYICKEDSFVSVDSRRKSQRSSRASSRKSSKENSDPISIAEKNSFNPVSHDVEENAQELDKYVKDLTLEEPNVMRQEEIEKGDVCQQPRLSAELPFSRLQQIDLSYNQFSDEDSLLAVAAWPTLSELIIHNNPLTLKHSGDPPLLTLFLQNQLGIHLQRRKSTSAKKPRIVVPDRLSRKIKVKVPPMLKCDVEKLLSLEAPASKEVTSVSLVEPIYTSDISANLYKPSLPVNSNLQASSSTLCSDHHLGDAEVKIESTAKTIDPFFMTQTEDTGDFSIHKPNTSCPVNVSKEPIQAYSNAHSKKISHQNDDYGILFEGDDDDVSYELPPALDISANIRALQYALNHPILFRENKVHLEKRQKPYHPLTKKKFDYGSSKTRQEKIDDILFNIKNRQTIVEAPLSEVLKDKKKLREFPEARRLWAQMQNQSASTPDSYSALEIPKRKTVLDETMRTSKY